MSKIKLCGITRLADIEVINQLKPDYIGFIFYPKSKRYINKETAIELRKHINKSIKVVGVFLDASIDTILDIAFNNIIDIIQLHGSESEDDINKLRKGCKLPIIKAFSITKERDVIKAIKSSSDYLLFDYKIAGSGQCFDWQLIKEVNRKYFLAGGINLENVTMAINNLHPYAIDVSSGIESNGKKDKDKMKAMVEIVRKEG